MTDEKYVFVQDCKDKKFTARSARNMRTHNGKGGRVKLPCDYLSRKELKAMNGEVVKYASLKKPMTWDEFKALPDDLKVTYIKSLRDKFNVPDKELADMFGVQSSSTLYRWFKCLGLTKGLGSGPKTITWNKEGWLAWLHGASSDAVEASETPVEETNVEDDQVEDDIEQIDVPIEERIKEAGPIAFAGNPIPVIPKIGTMTFEDNCADDVLTTIKTLLGNTRVNVTVSWEILPVIGESKED